MINSWRPLRRRQRAALLLVAGIGLVLSFSMLSYQQQHERAQAEDALADQGRDIARLMEHELDIHQLLVSAVQAFFAASQEVTRSEFHRFARPLFERYRGLRILAWVPLVPREAAAAWERRARDEGVEGFQIRSLGAPSTPGPAPTATTLLPIYFVEPDHHRQALGVDLSTSASLRRALHRVGDTGAVEITPRPADLRKVVKGRGFMVLAPVYRPEADVSTLTNRRKALLGFLLADSDADTLLREVVRRHRPRAVNVHIFDGDAGSLLAYHGAPATDQREAPAARLAALKTRPRHVERIHTPTAPWRLVVTPTPAFLAAHRTWAPWLAFGGFLLLGLLATLYIGSLLAATTRARATAADLAASKAALEREIGERARAEEERARLATAIEQAGETFIVTDLDGTIQYVNPAFERVTGYSREEALGQSIMGIGGGDPDDAVHAKLWATLARGEVWAGRFTNRRKDGTPYHDEASVAPVRDADGQVVSYVSVQRDITEQLRNEDRLRQVQKMEAMGTLAGGIAHDFNNILTAVLGHAELGMMDAPPGSPVYESLREIAVAGTRAAELVAQILAFSRRSEQERGPLQLQTVVAEALRLLRGSLPPTVAIEKHLDPGCPPVLASPGEIHQVVMNLGTNAFHAMHGGGGTLTVTLGRVAPDAGDDAGPPAPTDPDAAPRPAPFVKLTVRDTGLGMDATTRARIFEPYFTTKERGEGTGLGLSTVHGIVRSLGGTIEVESEPGQGSTFTLRLPCASAPKRPHAEEPAPAKDVAGTERVLLVDDEAQIARYLSTALGRMGYAVTVCEDGQAALERFQATPEAFDVVITDQMMPRLRGTELGQALHALRPDLPLILCSGFGDVLADLPEEQRVFAEVLSKPVTAAALARVVRRLRGEGDQPA